MCGIAGILSATGWTQGLERGLRMTQAALRHRGPDDAGVWANPETGVGLAHTRLAILDLSSAGHQPMISRDGRAVIVFNGEIYNFQSLRTSLEQEGLVFETGTDTEVLLCLYQREGAGMLNRLRGMFAFCIWDQSQGQAFLARDGLGIKPLYYSLLEGSLYFASEMKALLKGFEPSNDLDSRALHEYLTQGSVAEPATLLKSVRQLSAGHYGIWKAGAWSTHEYWKPHLEGGQPQTDPKSATRSALLDSVDAHFVSDVPVGLFLSGGIDSTALLALAKTLGKTDIQTFSIGVDDPALDESSVAQRTAQHFGSHHHEQRLTASTGQALFHDFLNHTDQPSVDGFNSFTVSAFARAQGMKVVLSGLGGDELFGGYPSFSRVPKLATWSHRLQRIPGLASGLAMGLKKLTHRATAQRFGALLQEPVTPETTWRAFRGIMTPEQATGVLERLGVALEPFPPREACPMKTPWPASDSAWKSWVSQIETTHYMRNQLLRDSDAMSMAHGLELRVPLVDQILLDALDNLPAAYRLQSGKQGLIQAVPEIPAWVQHQPKRGFTFPFKRWLEAEWGDHLQKSDQLLPMKNPTWYQRWTVFMLWQWLQTSR